VTLSRSGPVGLDTATATGTVMDTATATGTVMDTGTGMDTARVMGTVTVRRATVLATATAPATGRRNET